MKGEVTDRVTDEFVPPGLVVTDVLLREADQPVGTEYAREKVEGPKVERSLFFTLTM